MPASRDELRAMLAPLLAERFHLTAHRETRVLPIYALVVASKNNSALSSIRRGVPSKPWSWIMPIEFPPTTS